MNAENTNKMKQIDVIIIEDDYTICKEYAEAIAKESDIFLMKTTNNSVDAVELIKQHAPDVVILDLYLGDGGYGDDILTKIRALENAITQPGVAILTDNQNKNLRAYYTKFMGADALFTKHIAFTGAEITDIIRKTYDLIQKCGVNAPGGVRDIERIRPQSPIEKIRQVEDAISARLEKDGMLSGRFIGKAYLIDLIILAIQNGGMSNYILKDNFQIVAEKHKTTPSKVHRNLYNAIHATYDFVVTSEFELDNTPFKRPEKQRTPMSIIYYYAEIFRNALE